MSAVTAALSKASSSLKQGLRTVTTLPNGKSITVYMSPYFYFITLLKHPNKYIRYLTIPYCMFVFGFPPYLGLQMLNSNKEKSEAEVAARREKIIRTMGIEKDIRRAEEQA